MSTPSKVASDADLVIALKRATIELDEPRAAAISGKLFLSNPDWILRGAGPEELDVRLMAHEVFDEFLRTVAFNPELHGDFWRTLTLPTRGFFPAPILISNARWLRLFGSKIPDQGLELIDPAELAAMGFEEQAKALGRFISVNDGARKIDYDALFEALDTRLRPLLGHWAIAVYLASPCTMGEPRTQEQQASVAAAFTRRHENNTRELAGSTMFTNMPYALSYRADMSPSKLAPILNGQLTRRLCNDFGSGQADPTDGRLQAELAGTRRLVVCPNWRENHVAYRCMSAAVEAMRGPATKVLMVNEPGIRGAGTEAQAWAAETINIDLPGRKHFIQELGGLGGQLREAELEFLFYPEVTPNNASAWLATQRLARVQAAGYGYPVTTGSPHLDYFVGGSEVESGATEYSEQLVLLPGLGVSTTPPPPPSRGRLRGLDEAEVKVATITSWQKLNPALLGAWEAILGDQPLASLDAFTGMTAGVASSLMDRLSACVSKAQVNIHLAVQRDDILTTLEDADLYLDTFPYGGFNSLVEVLCAGCPVVTLEGPEARHRFGAAMLRRLELPSFLITKTPTEFIAAARRLLLDQQLRLEIRAMIGDRERVLSALADDDIAAHFEAAVEWMLERGPTRGRPGAPVVITAGEAVRSL